MRYLFAPAHYLYALYVASPHAAVVVYKAAHVGLDALAVLVFAYQHAPGLAGAYYHYVYSFVIVYPAHPVAYAVIYAHHKADDYEARHLKAEAHENHAARHNDL